MSPFPQLLKPKAGQAGLIAIAVSLVIMLVIGGASLSSLSTLNSQRNIMDHRTMQAYYIAQAGMQEALATRMMPRSNYLNFVTQPAGAPAVIPPYYNNSGLVYQQPNTKQQLLGVYRYLIVGGDPSRKADGSYYGVPNGPPFAPGPNVTTGTSAIPRLVTIQSNPPASPFYIISNGITCVKGNTVNGTDQGIDQFVGPANITTASQLTLDGNTAPQCKAGYSIQEVTLRAQVSMEQESGVLDKVDSVQIYADRTNVPLPASAFIPGAGWTNTVNFNTAWNYQGNTAGLTPARPTRMVFFKFGSNKIYQSIDLTGGGWLFTAAAPVPVDASMMLYFDGPIDYRSLSSNITGSMAYYYDKDLSGCKGAGVLNCGVRLYGGPPFFPIYTGLLVVPILPYTTKVLLLAPLGNNLSSGNNYHFDIFSNNIRSYSYAPGTNAATLIRVGFNTQ